MLLRPRQTVFVDRTVTALIERGNTLAVAPTGFGKTVAMAAIIRRLLAGGGRVWTKQPPTPKQLTYLPRWARAGDWTRYQASCHLARHTSTTRSLTAPWPYPRGTLPERSRRSS